MTAALDHLPTTDVDPFAPEVLTDPLGFQEELRAAGPLVRLTRHDVLALGRYAEVRAALVDWQSFRSGAGVGLANFHTEAPWRPPSLLLEADPPHHDAPRRVLGKVLGPRALRTLRDRWAADAEALVDEVLAGGDEFDAVPAIAEAFPLRVFPDAVGLPEQGRENLLPYGDLLFNAFGPRNALLEEKLPRLGELSAWVNAQCAREALAGEGFGADIWAAADRGELTPEQAPLVVRSLLSAGVDTTVTGLAAVLHAVARHPEQWARLRADPGLARVAFDEAVRWESPVQTFFRTTATDTELAGVRVPAGRKVLMFLGSANRDPRHWGPGAGSFDLDRDPSGHVWACTSASASTSPGWRPNRCCGRSPRGSRRSLPPVRRAGDRTTPCGPGRRCRCG
ncbi:cytochrome P450 [Pseudonocardia sp. ICBG1293]|uniref:cytochrome P450 n=1 Tax=Pseudonocardia sp. ICBG1293 TaxID=2844382 RepID=UPI0027E15B10|nr:cytochrome P450 [Pseudonocardia sp. ICBG1293]